MTGEAYTKNKSLLINRIHLTASDSFFSLEAYTWIVLKENIKYIGFNFDSLNSSLV